MPKKNQLSPQLKAAQKQFKANTKKILAMAATEAVNHFKTNFKLGGFMDRSLEKWKPRKSKKDKGRGVLIGKGSGRLKRSIKRSSLSATRTIIGVSGTPIKYASVHNFGLRSGRKKAPFTMPQRKFMGESKVLSKKISRLLERQLKKIL